MLIQDLDQRPGFSPVSPTCSPYIVRANLLIPFYVPDTLSHSRSPSTLRGQSLIVPCYGGVNWGLEKWNHLSELPQLTKFETAVTAKSNALTTPLILGGKVTKCLWPSFRILIFNPEITFSHISQNPLQELKGSSVSHWRVGTKVLATGRQWYSVMSSFFFFFKHTDFFFYAHWFTMLYYFLVYSKVSQMESGI